MVLFCSLVEGPCLLHTTTGNLLRTLRGPGECVRPRLLKLSRDGLVLINYTDGTGHLAVFTINGRLLSDKRLDDQMLVTNVYLRNFHSRVRVENETMSKFSCFLWSHMNCPYCNIFPFLLSFFILVWHSVIIIYEILFFKWINHYFRVTSLGGFTPWRDLSNLLALKFEGTDWINLVLKTARGIF